jgi:hypothetical protein
MPKATVILSPFHNLSAGDLVDQLGKLKAQIADLETREKALRGALIARCTTAAEGSLYCATITDAVRWTLDTKAVKAEMGATWYDAHCRQSVVTTVATKPRAVVVKLAA